MIEIKNQQFYEYNVDYNLDESLNTLFLFENSIYAYEYSLTLAGIKKANIYYLDKEVYENDIYFKSRIYINNNISYIDTLDANVLEEKLLKKYSKAFDKDYFKRLVNETKIRTLIKRGRKYKFKDNTLTLSNDILALSCMCIKCLYLPFNKLADNTLLKEEFKIKKSNIFISALDAKEDNFLSYQDIIDKLVIFYKEKVLYLDINDKILKINKDSNSTHITILKNLIYEDSNYYYVNSNILKDNAVKGLKYKEISIFDIYKGGLV